MVAKTMSRRGRIGGASALIILAAGAAVFYLREPGFPADAADGVYHNDCCGPVILRDGRMLLGASKSVDYEVGADEAGPYILPKTFVGTWEDQGFELDGSRAPLKLRLDILPRPTGLELPAATGSRRFVRKTSTAGDRFRTGRPMTGR